MLTNFCVDEKVILMCSTHIHTPIRQNFEKLKMRSVWPSYALDLQYLVIEGWDLTFPANNLVGHKLQYFCFIMLLNKKKKKIKVLCNNTESL